MTTTEKENQETMSTETAADVTSVKVPAKAKTLKDLDANIKETQVELVVAINGYGYYSRSVYAVLEDLEHLKRIREALK